MNSPVLVAVPSYGHNDMTRQAVADCLREQVNVVVIDNKGDYDRIDREWLHNPRENLGWGGACEWALKYFLDHKQLGHSIILLNNDVRLSENFCGGLLVTALQQPHAGIVTALTSVGSFEQLSQDGFGGPASEYQPRAECWEVGQADGTCVLITRECLEAVTLENGGTFDLQHWPKFGWGLMPDLCIRAREAGFRVLATAASYCEHLAEADRELGGANTAIDVFGSRDAYRSLGHRECSDGLRAKYGDKCGWLLLDDESRQEAVGVAVIDGDKMHLSVKEFGDEPAET